MAHNLQIKNSLAVLEYAIKYGTSILAAQQVFNFHENTVSSTITNLPVLLANKEITRKQRNQFIALYDRATTTLEGHAEVLAPVPSPALAQVETSVSAPARRPKANKTPENSRFTVSTKAPKASPVEKSFDEYVNEGPLRVKGTSADPVRDDDGTIQRYEYSIPVPGKTYKLKGELSREQMATIYTLYPYGTLQQMSAQFPQTPIEDLRRIVRAFRITKDTKYPQHILEERTEKEAAEFTLQAKAQRVNNKLGDYTTSVLEKQNRELAMELRKQRHTTAWSEELVAKTVAQYAEGTILVRSLATVLPRVHKTQPASCNTYTFFSDIHFGKYFPDHKHLFGRGNCKETLRERCLRIAEETILAAKRNNSKDVHLICGGDLFESVIPDGMHPGHMSRMDLMGHEQIEYGFKVFNEMLAMMAASLPTSVNITLHGIGGNHDRIQAKRDEDKGRTATLIFYSMLKMFTDLTYGDSRSIKIFNYVDDEGVIRFSDNKEQLSFIGHHGDAVLAKRSATELLNTFKTGDSRNFTILFQGHYHGQKVLSEGINYLHLQLGSVCSGDEYSQNNLGVGSQPSFIIGTRAQGAAYGFDFTKYTLA